MKASFFFLLHYITIFPFFCPRQLNRYIRMAFIVLSSPKFLCTRFLCDRMSSPSVAALMLLHFNCSATLSPSFMQFCWLHYLFSTSPLFANVLMSEFELFIHCCSTLSLNEYASLTIHYIMHIWSSQFKDNSSCHSHADLWYKDTFLCPGLSQNTRSFYQQSLQAFLPSIKTKKLIQITTRTHTFMAFSGFCKPPEIYFPPNYITACQVVSISFLFVPSAHFDTLWATFTSAFVVWLSPSQTEELKTH